MVSTNLQEQFGSGNEKSQSLDDNGPIKGIKRRLSENEQDSQSGDFKLKIEHLRPYNGEYMPEDNNSIKVEKEIKDEENESEDSNYGNLIIVKKEECTSENETDSTTSDNNLEIKIEYTPFPTEEEPQAAAGSSEDPSDGVNNETDVTADNENPDDSSGTQRLSFQCTICPYETDDPVYFSVHKKTHKTKYSCDSCHYICGSPLKLVYHQKKHHLELEDLLYYCGDCPFTSLIRIKLIMHRREEHKKRISAAQGEPLQCPKCSFKSSRNTKLVQHQVAVHNEPFFKCSSCRKQMTNEAEFKDHLTGHLYRKNKDGLFECKLCEFSTEGKHFIVKHHNETHQDSRTRDKKFLCDQCPYSTGNGWRMKQHRRRHTPVNSVIVN